MAERPPPRRVRADGARRTQPASRARHRAGRADRAPRALDRGRRVSLRPPAWYSAKSRAGGTFTARRLHGLSRRRSAARAGAPTSTSARSRRLRALHRAAQEPGRVPAQHVRAPARRQAASRPRLGLRPQRRQRDRRRRRAARRLAPRRPPVGGCAARRPRVPRGARPALARATGARVRARSCTPSTAGRGRCALPQGATSPAGRSSASRCSPPSPCTTRIARRSAG